MADDPKGLSAEQQLLALIEGQDKKAPEKAPASAPAAPGAGSPPLAPEPVPAMNMAEKVAPRPQAQTMGSTVSVAKRPIPVFSLNVIKARLAFIQDNINNMIKSGDIETTVDFVNNALIIGICTLFLFLGYEIFVKPKKIDAVSTVFNFKSRGDYKTAPQSPIKELSMYLDKLKQRDVFKLKPKEVKVETPAAALPAKPLIEDTIAELKLVGLSPSSDGENIAMIENTKTATTLFLKEGDTISGLTIEKILEDKIILTDGKDSRELR